MKGRQLTKLLVSFLLTIIGIISTYKSIGQATTLSAGDVAIIALGPSSTDQFAFVLLKDINTGTVINFTDNGFASTTTGYNNEGFVTYTAPSAQCAGTVLKWISGSGSNPPGFTGPSGSFALNASGEQLFAFQGTGSLATTNFASQTESTSKSQWAAQTNIKVLYGIQTDNDWITSGTTASGTSYLPTTSILPSADVIEFTSKSDVTFKNTTTSGVVATIITTVTTAGNYNTSSSALSLPGYTAFTVNPPPPTSSGNVTVTYNGLTHSVSASVGTGLVVDWYANLTGGSAVLSGSNTSPAQAAAGTYTYYAQARSTCTGANISLSRTQITLTINKAPLSITANNQNKTYGVTQSTPIASSTAFTPGGLQNGETVGTVTLAYSATALPANATAGSTSTITPSAVTGGTFAIANYTVTYNAGTLTVTKAALSITANDQNKTYGVTQNTPVAGSTTFTPAGLQNGETIGSVTLDYSATALPANATAGSTSTITPSAAASGTFNALNYTITYNTGTLTVTKALLTVTPDNKTVNYGDAIPSYTYSFTGFVNNENSSVVSGSPSLSSLYTSSTLPSASPLAISITAGNLSAANYSFSITGPGSIIVTTSSNIWTGGTNTNWFTTSNWDNGSVPSTNANIIIATGSHNFPMLASDITIGSFNLQAASHLNIGAATLTINGAISGNGTLTGSSLSSLQINSAAGSLNFTNSPDTLLNLTLGSNASATVASPLLIAAGTNKAPGKLTIGNNTVFNTGNYLTLASNDSSTAIVAPIPEDAITGVALGVINGTVTVNRYIHSSVNNSNAAQNGNNNISINNGLRAWRLLTAPVTKTGSESIKAAWQNNGILYNSNIPSTQGIGTLITGANSNNGLDATSGVSMCSWDAYAQSFATVSNTLDAISNGNYGGNNAGNTGYMIFVRGDRNLASLNNPNYGGININNTTLNPTGTLITGRQVYNIKPSTGLTAGQTHFTLIGNPYAAPVNLATLDTNNVRLQYYIWNPNLNTVGGFVTLDLYSGLTLSTPNSGYETQYIQSGQAFFAVGGIGVSDGTLTFNEEDKADSNNNYVFRPAVAPTASFRSDLYLANGTTTTLADGNLVQYNNDFNAGIDYLDALKLTNTNETFSLMRSGIKLAIERRPVITANDTLYFNLTQTTKRAYQFQFTATGLDYPGLTAFLKDSYTGDSTMLNLNSTTAINFSIDTNTASQTANRFMILFKRPVEAGPLPVTFTAIKATQQNTDNIAVIWDVQNELNIQSYEVEKSTDGKTYIAIGNVIAAGLKQYNFIDINAVTGSNYYRVRNTGSNAAIQYSPVAKIITGAEGASIAIYPNPVQNAEIGMEFTNMPSGIYIAKLQTTLGQVIATKTINHSGGSATQTIPFSKATAKGVYQLEIINTESNSVTSYQIQYQ